MVGNVQNGAPERVVLRCRWRPAVERAVFWFNVGRFASFERGEDLSSLLGSRFPEGPSLLPFPVAEPSQSTSGPNVLDLVVMSILLPSLLGH